VSKAERHDARCDGSGYCLSALIHRQEALRTADRARLDERAPGRAVHSVAASVVLVREVPVCWLLTERFGRLWASIR
jgi:hypothetical protein